MSDQHWKWRMHGAPVYMADNVPELEPDVIVCTDMMDVAAFRGILNQRKIHVPVITYFHESQTAYPVSSRDSDKEAKRDHHYTFINFTSALASNEVVFNSVFHKNSFLSAIHELLKRMPDYRLTGKVAEIEAKSQVMYPPLSDELFGVREKDESSNIPVILWNHRWEYDKNPEDFFHVLQRLKQNAVRFRLIVCGESFERCPDIFNTSRELFSDELIHWGYASSADEYMNLLRKSDILPVTSYQEYFGYSVTEAIACGVYPLLPDRLVYPEHVGNRRVLYGQTPDELFSQLLGVIQSKEYLKHDLSGEMDKYRWSSWISKYDNLISKYEE
jgi:glycosyltransferase involved in cell wall biosynthesis